MRSKRERKRSNNTSASSSPTRDRTFDSAGFELRPSRSNSPRVPRSTTLLDRELITEENITTTGFDAIRISSPDYYNNPRSFPHNIKQQCWDKAEKIKGRDPERWRKDYLGNIVFRKLVGCSGCLCHDYDHIVPYSKGGQSTLENCQVLQAKVNRSKGNRTDISRADLIQKSSYCRVSGRDMDLLEVSAYGNVRRGQDSRGCSIQ